MAAIDQVLNYVKQLNEKYNLLVANAKKIEELPEMETVNPDGLMIVSELEAGVWKSKRLELSKLIEGLDLAGQDNKVREVVLGTITEDHDLAYLLDNNGITVTESELIMLTALTTVNNTLVQNQYLWKLGKGEYNPIGSADINSKLLELQPRFVNKITADELASAPNAIVYDFGIITDPILDVLNQASPARDYTDDESIYYIRATKDGVNLLYNFVGTNGTYGDGESQMAEADLVLVYSSESTDITELLTNKTDKGGYPGTSQDLADEIEILKNFTPTPTTSFTGQPYMAWSGTGFKHDYNLPSYYIEGVLYPASTGDITPTVPADANPRYVSFFVDASGVNYRLGDAEENPRQPTIDPTTEIYITSFLVLPGATEPDGVAQNVMYNEQNPGEWTFYSNHANITSGNTVNPLDGSECIDATNTVNATYFELTAPEPQSIVAADGFKFWIKLTNGINTNRGFNVAFYDDSTKVSADISFKRSGGGLSNSSGDYGISFINTTSYQLIVIPYQDINFQQNTFNKVRFTFISTISAKFDYLALMTSGGGFGVSPDKKGISTIITDDGIKTVETPEASVVLSGSGGVQTYVDPVTGKIVVDGQLLSNRIDWLENYGRTVFQDAWIDVDDDGVVTDLNLSTTDSLSLNFIGTVSELQSIFYDSGVVPPYRGSIGFIKNSQAIDILIPHEELSLVVGRFAWRTPDEQDLVLKPKQILQFKTDGIADGYLEVVTVSSTIDQSNLAKLNADNVFEGNNEFTQSVSGVPATADEHLVTKAQLDLKLDASAYNDRFKGVYATLTALETAYPTANAGDNAQVNEVGATQVVTYVWDDEDGAWIVGGGSGSGAANTDELPEGSTNLYFTNARAIAAVDISGKEDVSNKSSDVDADKTSTTKYATVKAIYDWAVAKFQETLVSGTNIKTVNFKTLLGSGNVADALVKSTTVTGSYNLDWQNDTWRLTLTGNTTFTESNLPASNTTKTITLHVNGNYSLTYPTGWSTWITGAYSGTATMNTIVVEYIESGVYKVQISQNS